MLNIIATTMGCLIAILGGLVLIISTLERELKGARWVLNCIAALIYWSVLIGVFISLASQRQETGPCVTWETQMHYNPALKMMAPARVCTLRGEWVNP